MGGAQRSCGWMGCIAGAAMQVHYCLGRNRYSMTAKANRPWASGPGEILRHGLTLLKTDNDTNRRLLSVGQRSETMRTRYWWQCRILAPSATALLLAACARESPAPAEIAQAVELDHAYIWVEPGAPEVATLEALGFQVDATPTEHIGNGTSSKSVLFENAYLELIYRDSAVTDSSLTPAERTDNERRAHWRQSGAIPFGLGLRRRAGSPDALPFPSTGVNEPWMKPGTEIRQITTNEETEVPVFVVPTYMALPTWIGDVRADSVGRRFLHHSGGSLELTGLQLTLVAPERLGPGVEALARAGVVVIRQGSAPVATLTFNQGRRGLTQDLRPTLPLTLRY